MDQERMGVTGLPGRRPATGGGGGIGELEELTGAIAGIVAYHPDEAELARLIGRVAPDVVEVLVFANSPIGRDAEARLRERSGAQNLTLIGSGENVGLGAAYDAFVAAAVAGGVRHLLILDQDSLPAAGMVPRLAEIHARLAEAGERPAIVGPRPVGPDGVPMKIPVLRAGASRAGASRPGATRVLFAISSGSLVDVEAARAVGPFRADFFIDAIDIEWCLRAGAAGRSVWIADEVRMDHRLGAGVIRLGSRLHLADQPPRRLYTYIRNQLAMMRLPHVPLAYKAKLAATLPARIGIHLLRNRFSAACRIAVVRGLRDGFAGRLGAPERASQRGPRGGGGPRAGA